MFSELFKTLLPATEALFNEVQLQFTQKGHTVLIESQLANSTKHCVFGIIVFQPVYVDPNEVGKFWLLDSLVCFVLEVGVESLLP